MGRLSLHTALWLSLFMVGCKGKDATPTEADADTDTDTDTDTDADADTDTDTDTDSDSDADSDTDTDTDADADIVYDTPVIEVCTAQPPPVSGDVCDVTGDLATATHVLLQGDVLGDTTAYEGGAVLYQTGDNGLIECVGCDCAAAAPLTTVTVNCSDSVISPGLINAHDHIRYALEHPDSSFGTERYDHRNDWREGLRNHTELFASSSNTHETILWGEMRMLFGGATSINGSISSTDASGLLRNLDGADYNEGLGSWEVNYDTFPLGDAQSQVYYESDCDNYNMRGDFVLFDRIYAPHVAEGIDEAANNEFQCIAGYGSGATDLLEDNTSVIHGIGLKPADIEEMVVNGSHLIWSPRSNISLYGETAPVTTYHNLGVPIAIGTDWSPSGSGTLLREMQCAQHLDTTRYNDRFSDRELWLMATRNAAIATGSEAQIGALRPGLIADIAVFDGTTNAMHSAVVEADLPDVQLVMRGGKVLTGIDTLVEDLVDATEYASCETLAECISDHVVCVTNDAGMSLSQIEGSVGGGAYDLYICGTPSDEPSCEPSRDNEVDENGIADGMIYPQSSLTDADFDGIEDSADNCPNVFNPATPLNGLVQGDADGDGAGDACDGCPLLDGTGCGWFDLDTDGVGNLDDNCPDDANPLQEDADGDYIGDLCDACPNYASPSGSCPQNIYDVRDGTLPLGQIVTLEDMQVTASNDRGVFVQLPPSDPRFAGEDFSGMWVYFGAVEPKPQRGDRIDITGNINDFFSQIQLEGVTNWTALSTGNPAIPPVVVNTADIVSGGSRAAGLEGVLVRVEGVTVTAESIPAGPGDMDPTMEFAVDDGLPINDYFFLADPFPLVGESFDSITGVLRFGNDASKIEPRDAFDFISGPVQLDTFSPTAWSALEGSTFDLDLALLRPAGAIETATITCAPADIITCPATVEFAAGDLHGPVGITADAVGGPVTVTAELNGSTVTAEVVVYDDATPRTLVTLDPIDLVVSTETIELLTVGLDLPAPPGGITVGLASSGLLTVPTEVTIEEGNTFVTFDAEAGVDEGVSTITASYDGVDLTLDVEVSAGVTGDGLIFTEYIEGSSGNNKVLEIQNLSSAPVDLSDCTLNRYTNGNTSASGNTTLEAATTDGMLQSQELIVLCNPATDYFDLSLCDLESGVLSFNGDDALEITCGSTVQDIIGKIGEDPGSEWGTSPLSTANNHIFRNCDVEIGDRDGSDDYDPATEWNVGTITTIEDSTDIGLRTCP